jgi:hypothetical protein|tara:strand:+ start:494 stop:688 length:195 start_codon:yes stop_codon:yes gene_type:complete
MIKKLTVEDLNTVKLIIGVVNSKDFGGTKRYDIAMKLAKGTARYCTEFKDFLIQELKRKGITNE